MKIAMVVIFTYMLLAGIGSSAEEESNEVGDWLSGGYVVTPAQSVHSWGPPWISYSVYHDSTFFDPWYRTVAWPYLSNWYWPPYYRNGIKVYPVHYNYYYHAPYWYNPVWGYPTYH